MKDPIERQDAIDAIKAIPGGNWSRKRYVTAIKELPPAQSEPCEDAISRQDAIDALLLDPGSEQWQLDAIKALPSVTPKQQWIPCSERLPERGKDVLVTRDYDGREDNNKSCRYVEVASCYGEDDDITWSSFSDEYKMKPRNHHVIAWRELPEPYREDKPWSTC